MVLPKGKAVLLCRPTRRILWSTCMPTYCGVTGVNVGKQSIRGLYKGKKVLILTLWIYLHRVASRLPVNVLSNDKSVRVIQAT